MILIHTYAKVFTTSLTQLLSERFPGEVYHSHGLEPWIVEPFKAFAEATTVPVPGLRATIGDEALRQRLAEARSAGESITVITGVRDPITRSLSVAHQNLAAVFADCLAAEPEDAAKAVAARVAALWQAKPQAGLSGQSFLEQIIRAPLDWFREEVETPFGFDLLAAPFDRARGYMILQHGNVRLLLFRHEKAPAAIERGLAELFPGMNVRLPHSNDGSEKPTADLYATLKRSFRLPRATLEAIYGNPYVSAFLDPEEIAEALNRWSEQQPGPPARPRATFAATVFIPLRNHANWIGPQLDSLFAQWRSDTELVLVDDGSTDGSFAAALNRLSGRPEVAATVMRNGEALGHGMLATVVSLSRAPVIIQADSDDITLPGRLDAIIAQFAADPDCRLLTSNAVKLSEDGLPIGLFDTALADEVLNDPLAMADRQNDFVWLGATAAYHRSVLEAFPPIDPELCPYGLDLLTGLRAVMLGSHHYLSRPLVGWRQHPRNSHRVSGWLGSDQASREHASAMKVMIGAQRLRDIAWMRSQTLLDPTRAAAIEARWQADLVRHTDDWIRERNRLTGTHASPAPKATENAVRSEPTFVPAVPPIFTLQSGQDHRVSEIGGWLARCSGFYNTETDWIWTSRLAMVSLRIPDPNARSLTVTFTGPQVLSEQRVYVSLNFSDPIEVRLTGGELSEATLPIVGRDVEGCDLFTLLIQAADATTPAMCDPQSLDTRLLGVALHALRVQ